MAASQRVSAIHVLKSSIAALERQLADMKTAADLLASSPGLPPPNGEMRKKLPTLKAVRDELPSGDFRLDIDHSFSSQDQD